MSQTLLFETVKACEALSRLVKAIYRELSSASHQEKADKSLFSIADGMVQTLLINQFLVPNGFAVVGEEDVVVDWAKMTVGELEIPSAFKSLILETQAQVKACGVAVGGGFQGWTAFVDPIDGTREFCTKLGEQCTICVGYARHGQSYAGVVMRPIPLVTEWAAGCKAEMICMSRLNTAAGAGKGLLTSNGGISPFLVELMKVSDSPRVGSGGCGNKVLMLLEQRGEAYIQDRGVSRWDTCAAQAILEAFGGILVKMEGQRGETYTYQQQGPNADFTPGLASLSPYNCSKVAPADLVKSKALATDAAHVKPHSNLNGLIALRSTQMLVAWMKHIDHAAKVAKPQFN